jgi:transposase InsO family protein
MIEKFAVQNTVVELCGLMGVSTSGYYAWAQHRPSQREQADQTLALEVQTIYKASRETYGSPRVTRALRKKGTRCGQKRVARLMKQKGLRGVQKARYRPRTTDSRHSDPISPNLLAEGVRLDRQNQVWASDITYLPTLEGWLYLAAFMDLKTRKIVGWAARDTLKTVLVTEAFTRAVFRERPGSGLIVHSDRGCQYASRGFRNLLEAHQALSSMAGKGHCYDNAAMESFWATLKTDMRITKPFKTKEDARLAIFDYIEIFYNRFRLHSALGDCSPLDYENQLSA